MRHDPASGAVVIMLRSLKMYGMAQAVTDLIEQGAPAFDAAVPILSQLLKAELAEREVRSIAYHLKVARFPAYKDLSGFDFASSEINEATVRQLHRCEFLDGAQNVERQPTCPLPTTMMAGFGRCDEIAYSLISSLMLSLATVSSRLSLDVVARASTSADCLLAAARRR